MRSVCCLLVVVWASAEASAGVVVRLRPAAQVAGATVRLRDVAAIHGTDPALVARLSAIEILPLSSPEGAGAVDVPAIKERLRQANIPLVQIEFAGAYRVTVSRNAAERRVGAENAEPSRWAAHPETPGTAAGEWPGPAARGRLQSKANRWHEIIAALLRPHIANGLGVAEEALELDLEAGRALEFLDQNQPATWDLVTPAAWRLGSQPVTLEAKVGEHVARIPIGVTVVVERAVVVARRRIVPGETIASDDIQLVRRRTSDHDPAAFASVTDVVGKQAERPITPDRPVTPRDVRNPPVVFRNNPVTVHVRHRTAHFTLQVMARDDGAVGDFITVVNPTNRQTFEVRVTGLQTAELLGDRPAQHAPPGLSALARHEGMEP